VPRKTTSGTGSRTDPSTEGPPTAEVPRPAVAPNATPEPALAKGRRGRSRTVEMPAVAASPSPAVAPPWVPPLRLRWHDRYLLERWTGLVAGGAIYEARDLAEGEPGQSSGSAPGSSGRPVEIIVCDPAFSEPSRVTPNRERLERLLAFVHPNLGVTLDVGACDGLLFVVAEPRGGASFSAWRAATDLPIPGILKVFSHFLMAVEAIHDAGTVHGALGPEAFRVVDGRGVVLPPWWLDSGETAIEGLPAAPWTPPELVSAARPRVEGDTRALALLLGEALLGRAIGLNEPLPAAVGDLPLPAEVGPVLARAIDPDPAARFTSVAALRLAVEQALGPLWAEVGRPATTRFLSSLPGRPAPIRPTTALTARLARPLSLPPGEGVVVAAGSAISPRAPRPVDGGADTVEGLALSETTPQPLTPVSSHSSTLDFVAPQPASEAERERPAPPDLLPAGPASGPTAPPGPVSSGPALERVASAGTWRPEDDAPPPPPVEDEPPPLPPRPDEDEAGTVADLDVPPAPPPETLIASGLAPSGLAAPAPPGHATPAPSRQRPPSASASSSEATVVRPAQGVDAPLFPASPPPGAPVSAAPEIHAPSSGLAGPGPSAPTAAGGRPQVHVQPSEAARSGPPSGPEAAARSTAPGEPSPRRSRALALLLVGLLVLASGWWFFASRGVAPSGFAPGATAPSGLAPGATAPSGLAPGATSSETAAVAASATDAAASEVSPSSDTPDAVDRASLEAGQAPDAGPAPSSSADVASQDPDTGPASPGGPEGGLAPILDPDAVTCPAGMAKARRKLPPAAGTQGPVTWEVYCIDRAEYPGGGQPTVNVDLGTARAQCAARKKRLCTSSEWRRACGGKYPYGATFEQDRCHLVGPSGTGQPPVATGSKPGCRSWLGLVDMVGNVAEWTSDGTVNGGSSLKDGDNATCGLSSRRAGGAPHIGFRCCADPTR
jgi:hypothetical protein